MTTTIATAIETHGLTKVYDGRTVLDNVSLHIADGSVFGLVGPNGAGKTTLLSILMGLRRATSGNFAIASQRVAILPDTPNFEPWLTAFEFVDLSRALTSPHLRPERSRLALAEAGLANDADRRIGGFSRGMLQRLGMAATLIGEPEVLFLDEPASALDPLGRREILELIARQKGSRTVVFSSHILSDVQEVCDSIGILKAGRLVYQGGLEQLLLGDLRPTYLVRLHSAVEAVAGALGEQAWVSAVEVRGGEEVAVTVESITTAESELVRVLADAGAAVVSMRMQEPSLEEVFLQLTE